MVKSLSLLGHKTSLCSYVAVSALFVIFLGITCDAFVAPTIQPRRRFESIQKDLVQVQQGPLGMAYIPPETEEPSAKSKKKPLHPKVGDMVRYYDIDGGREDGEVLVGRISFISTDLGKENSWTVELTGLEDVGDGYFAEYPSRKRQSKKAVRNLADVSPIMASFVRAESAYKVPLDPQSKKLKVRAEQYDLDDYQGPFAGANEINRDVLVQDEIVYSALKGKLLRNAAIAGAVGALITDLVKGAEDAIIYAAGALASLGYLFFLSVKTDTMGSQDSKLGKNVSNLRFLMPVFVIVGVALYNKSLGDANPVQSENPFDTVTTEQFGAAVLGFLTYRIPLFLTQIIEGLRDDSGNVALPGSAGVAMKLAQDSSKQSSDSSSLLSETSLIPVVVVSGPQATGRSELVDRLITEGGGRFVRPKQIDQVKDGITFERLQNRGEILEVDKSGRFGLTKTGILTAAGEMETESVVVVDADVDLAKKLTKMSGARLIGVWVGLKSVKEFETRLEKMLDSGEITIPEDETKESVIRARIRAIVQEIEYGISSGVFEFTILNENDEDSVKQLREAANYAFR
jgi:guanylate kinase